MKILVSNDDGYFSPGIAVLARAAQAFGEVTVIAPERDRSGASNSLTLDRPLSVRTAATGFRYVNGTPTDCVHIGMTGLLDRLPDLVISGINDGPNMGDDTIYSGTVAAAMEGFLLGVPAVAFSLSKRGFEHLDTAEQVVTDLLTRLIDRGLSEKLLLNVNIPACPPASVRGTVVTRLGKRHPTEGVIQSANPRGETIYWIGPVGAVRDAGAGTDFHAVENAFGSVTPLDIDLTGRSQIDAARSWIESV